MVVLLGDCKLAVEWQALAEGFQGSRWPLSESAGLLLGGSLLSYALQILLQSKSSNWLTDAMWSVSLSAVASGAWTNGCSRCRLHWLASACFALPVDQKLVVGLEMHCDRLPHQACEVHWVPPPSYKTACHPVCLQLYASHVSSSGLKNR
jgi:hypothetical protein